MSQPCLIGRPESDEFAEYFSTYINLVDETDVLNALRRQVDEFRSTIERVPADQENCLHDPYTWTIRQVVGHVTDTERIFACRALRFAAGDDTPLPGFDQDTYAAHTDYSNVTLDDLAEEFFLVRRSNVAMFGRLPSDTWQKRGLADGKSFTVRAIAYVLVGHARHHLTIIQSRI